MESVAAAGPSGNNSNGVAPKIWTAASISGICSKNGPVARMTRGSSGTGLTRITPRNESPRPISDISAVGLIPFAWYWFNGAGFGRTRFESNEACGRKSMKLRLDFLYIPPRGSVLRASGDCLREQHRPLASSVSIGRSVQNAYSVGRSEHVGRFAKGGRMITARPMSGSISPRHRPTHNRRPEPDPGSPTPPARPGSTGPGRGR